MLKQYVLGLAVAVLSALPLCAESSRGVQSAPLDTARRAPVVSLLTCSPGTAVYELYGHTALRVKGEGGDDWVFNYGTFSFRQPHFVWRFVLGNTDYCLSVSPYSFFYEAYARDGRGVSEQRLNLTPVEARRLEAFLAKNLEPGNATYRYNFFYDNCTTRAVDAIAAAVDGRVVWPVADGRKTLRDIVHQYSAASPWNKFGQDLLLGAEADKPADTRHQMFAPLYAQMFADSAMVRGRDGSLRHLVAPSTTLLPAVAAPMRPFPVSPMAAFVALLMVVALLTAWEWYARRNFWPLDALLLLAQGLAGCVIAFLFFFSAHPAVGSNWLVVMFNPLPLLYLPWYMKHASLRRPVPGMYVQGVMLAVTLAVGLAGMQRFPAEVYLIIAALAFRCAASLLRARRVRA